MGRKAEAGIGSLILFIAMVLVAAAAAAVFISTSNNLQNKATSTASGAQAQVSTRVQILTAWGENASATGNIGDIYFKIKLGPGSNSFSLNNSIVGVSTSLFRQTYRFNQSSGCSSANLSLNVNKFLVSPLLGYNKSGYLQDGDLLNVCLRMPSNLSGDSLLAVQFFPPAGMATSFSVTTPSVLADAKTQLYP